MDVNYVAISNGLLEINVNYLIFFFIKISFLLLTFYQIRQILYKYTDLTIPAYLNWFPLNMITSMGNQLTPGGK